MQVIKENRKMRTLFQFVLVLFLTNSTLWILCCTFNFGAEVILSLFKFVCRCTAPIMLDLLTCNWHSALVFLVDFVDFNEFLEICLSSCWASVLGCLLHLFMPYNHYFVTKSWIHPLDRCRWFAKEI